jgi:hypothetical protein
MGLLAKMSKSGMMYTAAAALTATSLLRDD